MAIDRDKVNQLHQRLN